MAYSQKYWDFESWSWDSSGTRDMVLSWRKIWDFQDFDKWYYIPHLARSAKLPTGLYILLALISYFFLFFFSNDFSENNYLRIRWTDFHDLFTQWKRFRCRWSISTSFFDISGDVAMATNFVKKRLTPHFRRSDIQKCNRISLPQYVQMMPLYPVKILWT